MAATTDPHLVTKPLRQVDGPSAITARGSPAGAGAASSPQLPALTPPPFTSAKLAGTLTALLQLPYQPRELVYPFSLPKADQAEGQKLARRMASLKEVFETTRRLCDAPSLLLLWPYNYKAPLVLPIEAPADP